MVAKMEMLLHLCTRTASHDEKLIKTDCVA
jgi:hypothetical protein